MSKDVNRLDYLRDLSRWQASSDPDLATRKPEELFKPDFAERYHRFHKNLWWRITRVHGTLYTLDRLKQFPFEYLYGPDRMEFWRLVVENFLDTACLILHGLVTDTGEDVLSLRSFHNEIAKAPWLCREKRDLLIQTLRERKFDKAVESIEERVDKIRDTRIAHRLVDRQSGSTKEVLAGVSLEELWRLFDAAHRLFGALSFGAGYLTLAGDLTPGTVGGQPRRTCLDGVLDGILRDSHFVNQPERRARWWPELRRRMDPESLRTMNDLRKRIGLPEA